MPKLDSKDKLLLWLGIDNPDSSEYARRIHNCGDLWWHYREQLRFESGDYKSLPEDMFKRMLHYDIMTPVAHFLHLSNEPGMVAYTPDDKAGLADRQVRTRFGRYLRNALGVEDTTITAELSELLRSLTEQPKLQLARTVEDIVEVYMNGPSSCMAGNEHDWDHLDVHPSAVYATDDCAVGYIKRGSRIVARAVLDMTRNKYYRIYGSERLMEHALKDAGYEYSTRTLAGCELRAIRCKRNDSWIMPYLDCINSVNLEEIEGKKWFVVCEDGEYLCDTTNGLLNGDLTICHECDSYVAPTHSQYLEYCDRYVCSDCLESNYVWAYIGRFSDYVHADSEYYEYRGDYYTYDALEYQDLVLLESGDVIHVDDAITDEVSGDLVSREDAIPFYREENGEEFYTKNANALVWSEEHDCYIDADYAYCMSDGTSYVFTNSEEARRDKDQIQIPLSPPPVPEYAS